MPTNPGFAGAGTSVFGPWLAARTYRATHSTAYTCGVVETRWVSSEGGANGALINENR